MRAAVMNSIEFTNQALSLLKRKADVLCKLHYKLNKNQDLLAFLLQASNSEHVKARQFAMYAFEVIAEVSLSSEELAAAKDDFMGIFKKALEDSEVSVKVAALKAITAFVSSIDDQEIVLGFQTMMEPLLDTVVLALNADEEQGRLALESMVELTMAHAEIWKSSVAKLLFVSSEVAKNKDFEEATRRSAVEIVLSLS
jgi:hypothetical protein